MQIIFIKKLAMAVTAKNVKRANVSSSIQRSSQNMLIYVCEPASLGEEVVTGRPPPADRHSFYCGGFDCSSSSSFTAEAIPEKASIAIIPE